MQVVSAKHPSGVFLPRARGNLFMMYYPATAAPENTEHLIYVHPFAGEMGNSRDVIAGLARDAARRGTAVLVVDLYGCGDSGGDFSEARWEIWREDLEAAFRWLEELGVRTISLWGLRLGALLAMDFAGHSQRQLQRILLWEPVLDGSRMLTQFLRMNLTPEDCDSRVRGQLKTPELRAALRNGQTIPVAGYEVASELISSIDKLKLAPLGQFVSAPIHCLQIVSRPNQPQDPALHNLLEGWKRAGIAVSSYTATGWPFWLFPYSSHYESFVESLSRMLDGRYP